MGNHHPKLNAAEGGSIFDSFKSKLATNEPQVVTGTTETGDASQASTSELQSSTRVAESPEDPNRIESTLTPFPGTWNDLHKIKGIFPFRNSAPYISISALSTLFPLVLSNVI